MLSKAVVEHRPTQVEENLEKFAQLHRSDSSPEGEQLLPTTTHLMPSGGCRKHTTLFSSGLSLTSRTTKEKVKQAGSLNHAAGMCYNAWCRDIIIIIISAHKSDHSNPPWSQSARSIPFIPKRVFRDYSVSNGSIYAILPRTAVRPNCRVF
jgi:hypothetical protein